MKKKYTPISCDFHSILEHFAIKKESITLKYTTLEDVISSENGIIADIYTKDGEEFLTINSKIIRLDKVTQVNDIDSLGSCEI